VTDTALASDIHQSLDVHLSFGTEFPFHFYIVGDPVTDFLKLIIRPILNFDVKINPS